MCPSPSAGTTKSSSGIRWLATLIAAGSCIGLLSLVLLVVASWLVGDHSLWWQTLSWVPAVGLLPPLVLAMLVCWFLRTRTGAALRFLTGLQLLFVASWVVGVDYGMYRALPPEPGDCTMVHWNAASNWGEHRSGGVLEDIMQHRPDVVVITNPGQRLWSDQNLRDQTGCEYIARNFAVLVVSRHPIIQCRMVLAASGAKVARVVLALPSGELELWAVDFPSDPSRVRSEVFQTFSTRIQGLRLPPPDLVMGDFNVPRNSLALRDCFPEMGNAFDLAGVGWYGTWPSNLPLWQLDQVLVAPELTAVRYQIFPSRVGEHRVQLVVIRDVPRYLDRSNP